ncbi:MAG: PAS domain S-box protein, partial [bacterium]|nr:PAS domain S-box protein [bacterium]
MIRSLKQLSIGHRTTLLGLLAAVMATSMILIYFPAQFSEIRYADKIDSDHALTQILAQSTLVASAAHDTTSLNNTIRTAEECVNLAFAILISADGRIEFKYDPSGLLSKQAAVGIQKDNLGYSRVGDVDLHIVEYTPPQAGGHESRFIVGTYLDRMHGRVASSRLAVFIVAGLFLCIGVLISFSIGRVAAKPLGLFVKAAQKVSSGNFDIGELKSAPSELSALGEAFRKMAGQIENQIVSIKENEHRYRSVVEYGGNGILVLCNNSVVFANRMVSKIIGYEDQEFSRPHPLNHVYPKDRKSVIRALRKLHRNPEGPVAWECRVIDKEGEVRWVKGTGASIRWDHQDAILVFISDITEHKRDEDALRFTRNSIDRIPESAFWVDSSGRLAHFNRAVGNLLDRSTEELKELRFYEFDKNLTRSSWQQLWKDTLQKGHLSFESEFVTQRETEVPVEVSANYLEFSDSEYLFIIVRDISGRIAMARALRESEERHRSIIENAGDSIALVELESLSFVEFNRRAHEDLGYSREAFSSLNLPDLLTELSPAQIDIRLDTAVSSDEIERFSAQTRTATGKARDIQVTARRLDLSERTYISLIWQDVTDRKNWEEKLAQLAEFPRGNPNMVLSMTREGNIVFNNPAVETTLSALGLGLEDIWKIFPDNLLDVVHQSLGSDRSSNPIESRYGGRSWLWIVAPVKGRSVIHIHAIDITERLESEEQRRKLSAAVEQSHNTVIITDTSGLIEYANPQFQKVSGMALDEVKKLEVSIVKSGVEGPREYQRIWEAIETDHFWTGNLKNRTISGGYYWAREVVSPILDKDSEIIGYLFVGQDITKEIELQQKVIESDKLSAIGMLAAGVAHEFKNYLGGIIGNASFALDDIDTENGLDLAKNTLEQIISLGERANDVAMSLLTYSRAKPE